MSTQVRARRISPEQIDHIKQLDAQGFNFSEISQQTKVCWHTVRRTLRPESNEIGFRKVQAYFCKGCKYRVTVKPCVYCTGAKA